MRPDAKSVAELGALNWGLLEGVLQCPVCAHRPLRYHTNQVSCPGCAQSFRIEGGIIDFIVAAQQPSPRLYRNPFYRRFIERLEAMHAAHYQQGSFSARIEAAIKRDLFRLVEPADGPSVDLGCGLGEGFQFISDDAQIVGVDASMPLLMQTKRLHPRASIVRANLARLPFREGALQRIFANAVLEHVFHLESALEEIQRCLAPSGRFYVAVPTEGSLAVAAARLVTSSRNARIIDLTPAQSRAAQRIDHCNTVFGIESALKKFFSIQAESFWPFIVPNSQINLAKAFRLAHLRDA